jgi:hypothetical protein
MLLPTAAADPIPAYASDVPSPGGDEAIFYAYRPETPDDPPMRVRPALRPDRLAAQRSVWTRGPYRSIQVNVDAEGNNIPGDAANEPSIAIDPTDPDRMVIGWRQFDTILSNFRQAGWAYSHNGGEDWTFPGVIEPGFFRSDPVLEADSTGGFYYLSLSVPANGVYRCDVFRSDDGGVTWPVKAAAFGGDKPWMVIDRTGGIGDGNIYVKWQSFYNCCGLNTFTRSIDGGLSFEFPHVVPLGPTFGTLDVGPEGEVYAAGIEAVTSQNPNSIVMARSFSAQVPTSSPSFELQRRVDLGGVQPFGGSPNPDGLLGQIQVVTDHSGGSTHGNVYMLASVNPPGPDPLDVKLIRSTNQGFSWEAPVRVNDDNSNNNWQWFGTVSVAPTGRIDAIWNDTRDSGQANVSELFYAFSTDAGETWSPNIPVSPTFDSRVGWPNQQKIGDYYDMISDAAGANIAYAATFNGEQDVYFLRVGDCNANGVHDGIELEDGSASDCNENFVPDACDIASGTSEDADGDGRPDECRIGCEAASEAFLGRNLGTTAGAVPDGVVPSCNPVAAVATWFEYTAVCTAAHELSTLSSVTSPRDTVITVFDACDGNEIACDDDGGPDLLSRTTFEATLGQTYFIRVATLGLRTGEVVLNVDTLGRCIRLKQFEPIKKGLSRSNRTGR